MVLRFFILAITFLFMSCAEGERDNPYDPWSKNYNGQGSSASTKNYCVYAELRQCYFGIYSTCPGVGGKLADECPYNSSSSAASSSSSAALFSSSSLLSSSSNAPLNSSSTREYDYCVFISDGMCLTGPLSSCPPGGTMSNSCPYGSSSSVGRVSSSSVLGSSSSSSYGSSSSGSSSSGLSSSSSSSSSLATYTITYNAGTGVTGVTVPANQTKTHDIQLILSNIVPTRSGYTFIGWTTTVNGTGTLYSAGAIYTVNGNITLYAQWTTLSTYTITFNANGGTNAPAQQIKTQDVSLTLSTTVPTMTGYAFTGWNTAFGGNGTAYAAGASYTANASVTLYAQWTVVYTVTYNGNGNTGGTVPAAQTQTSTGQALVLSGAGTLVRTGYVFSGWGTTAYDGMVTVREAGTSYTPIDNFTFYAQWSRPAVSNCNGITFKTTVIGPQTWMAENLNCNISGSKCYNNDEANCDKYGRLYDWVTAMALPSNCNSTSCSPQISVRHKGICPSGWRLPNIEEWISLVLYIYNNNNKDCEICDAKFLKTTNGWSNNGLDSYGFSALPGGYSYYYDGKFSFSSIGQYGLWWTASEGNNASDAKEVLISNGEYSSGYGNSNGNSKERLNSIRCIQDNSNIYTVTYNANGGTGAPMAQIKTPDASLGLSITQPSRTGYTFNGWNTKANGTGTYYGNYSTLSYTDNASVTLYAQWITYGTPITYGGETYNTVVIGTQTWMAKDLNYEVEGISGKYNWATAMALPSSCLSTSCASQITAKHRGICPSGWHLPSKAEWDALKTYIENDKGCTDCDAKYLFNYHHIIPFQNSYGFSALIHNSNSMYSWWWSASENGANNAYVRCMNTGMNICRSDDDSKSNSLSVRCLKD